jgi:hypothetical protein
MIIGIDHLVLPTAGDDVEALRRRLLEIGMTRLGDGESGDHGTANTLLAFDGGGFLELTWEREPGAAPFPGLFEITSRVAGVGFTSDEFDEDRTRFADAAEAWLWEREWVRSDGERLGYRAAGPIPVGEAYLFLMEGSALPNVETESKGRLVEVRLTGKPAKQWLEIYESSLDMPFEDGRCTVGHTDIVFAPDDGARLVTSITLAGTGVDESLPLAQGEILLRP